MRESVCVRMCVWCVRVSVYVSGCVYVCVRERERQRGERERERERDLITLITQTALITRIILTTLTIPTPYNPY
jgi:heme/copper-type cytochrome/quinol oxidase subunit 2